MLRKLRYIRARILEVRARAAQKDGRAEEAARLMARAEEIFRRIDAGEQREAGRETRAGAEVPHA
ncbi:hypothetical protein [Amaricoccus solimangrovi]|uniref:Uncharacterized protein n=1 Tax=Amaricoccus solimangrovi TaxID=2589815 RepID=A0A501WNP0_9RHOB|nr:hypothetical protein [Amaricoccus solimangrovi]TPE49960.1 hypothetical protein FJM51_13480 [Amaricoccus solimangrovi]